MRGQDSARIDEVLDRAAQAQSQWKRELLSVRASVLKSLADLYNDHTDRLALEMANDMGKPISQGRQEIATCVAILNYYADNADSLLADTIIEHTLRKQVRVANKPIGVVLGIMPWNFPHYQVIRFVAPNLLLGNTVVLKHASICSRSAQSIERLVRDASSGADLLVNSNFSHDEALSAIADNHIAAVSFTGGNTVGAIVASAAGAAVKKSVLELGGNDPFIIWDESRFDELVQKVARQRLANAGQTCVSPKRVIVPQRLLQRFIDHSSPYFLSIRPGDPTDERTELGPLSSIDAANAVRGVLVKARSEGATVLGDANALKATGAEMSPFIVVNPPRDSVVWQQEIFGPVLVVASAKTTAEAIELANDSVFGLGATVYANSQDDLSRFEAELECGMLACNGPKGGDPSYPFGGVKQSGYGRELGAYGIREFANQQLYVRHQRGA